MTETREITSKGYTAILDMARDLHAVIARTMNELEDTSQLTGEWHQLHCMLQASAIVSALADNGFSEARAAETEPVPFRLASLPELAAGFTDEL
jgi:hypothetical protein